MPLIVLTADRPPELREVGAGQAIDQIKLYGSAAKWFVEVGTHDPGRETAIHHRALACRAYCTAAGGRPGPVHLNFPLREPLAPAPEELDPADWQGREDGRPWTELREHASAPHSDDVHDVAARIAAEPRGVIVCGPSSENDRRARRPPRRADGLADARRADLGREMRRPRPLARDRPLRRAAARRPVRARAGPPGSCSAWATCPRRSRFARLSRQSSQIVIDPHGAWHEPTRTAELVLQAAAAPTLDALASAVEMRTGAATRAGSRAGGTADAKVWDGGRGGARRLRGQGAREPRAGAARRGARLGQLLDADPRRRGLLPPVGEAAAVPRQPRRERDRRRGLVRHGRGDRERPAHLGPDRRAGAAARRGRAAGGAPRGRRTSRSCASTTAAAGSSTSCPWPSTPIPPPMRLTSRPRQRGSSWRRSGPGSERSGQTAARTSRSTVSWWSGSLSPCSRAGRSCGGSARRPCRRPSRRAGSGSRPRQARSRRPR